MASQSDWALFTWAHSFLFLNIPSVLWRCWCLFFSLFTPFTKKKKKMTEKNPHKYWENLKNSSNLSDLKVENIEHVINISWAHTCCMGRGQCIINLSCITTVTWMFASCERLMKKSVMLSTYTDLDAFYFYSYPWMRNTAMPTDNVLRVEASFYYERLCICCWG